LGKFLLQLLLSKDHKNAICPALRTVRKVRISTHVQKFIIRVRYDYVLCAIRSSRSCFSEQPIVFIGVIGNSDRFSQADVALGSAPCALLCEIHEVMNLHQAEHNGEIGQLYVCVGASTEADPITMR
jgi:hypothetical protein